MTPPFKTLFLCSFSSVCCGKITSFHRRYNRIKWAADMCVCVCVCLFSPSAECGCNHIKAAEEEPTVTVWLGLHQSASAVYWLWKSDSGQDQPGVAHSGVWLGMECDLIKSTWKWIVRRPVNASELFIWKHLSSDSVSSCPRTRVELGILFENRWTAGLWVTGRRTGQSNRWQPWVIQFL